jgi:hypothetical protein
LPASAGPDLTADGYSAPAITSTPRPSLHVRPRLGRRALGLGCAAVAVGAVLPAQAVQAAPTPASAPVANTSANWSFTTVDNPADLTFNQLLGINDFGVIAGYYGSGAPAATHPNKGYRLMPYTGMAYVKENYPASQQTQVTAINDWGNTVGFYANQAGTNHGFLDEDGVLTSASDPNTTSNPPVNQLLGLNNNGIAVGFYNDAKGNAHAYEWNRKTGRFTAIDPFGSSSATATGINDHGTVAGFYAEANGNTAGFIMTGKSSHTVEFPGSTNTQIFGLNNSGTVVGMYVGAHKSTHGFIYSNATYRTIDDPNGIGNTVVNGLNNEGAIVGFYTDAKGNTDGFVANVKVAGVPTA